MIFNALVAVLLINVCIAKANNEAGEAKVVVPDFCSGVQHLEGNADAMFRAFHDIMTGVCGTKSDRMLMITGCHLYPSYGAHGLLCKLAGVPTTVGDWDRFFDERDRLCGLKVGVDMKCELHCPYHTADVCNVHAPLAAKLMFAVGATVKSNATDAKRERIIRSNVLIRGISHALKRNWANLFAQILSCALFIKPLKGVTQIACMATAVFLYLSYGQYVQAAAVMATALVTGYGANLNLNNIYLAFGGVIMSVVLIAVDAVDDVWFSFAATVLLFFILFTLAMAILTKKVTIDVGTLTHFTVAIYNLVSYYRVIILSRTTDPFVASLIYVLDSALPYGAPLTAYFVTRVDEARTVASIIVNAGALEPDAIVPIFMALFIFSYTCFIALRGLLGFQVMRRVRTFTTAQAFFYGFLLVWTDVLSPLHVIVMLFEGKSARLFSFALCSALLKYFEFIYAPELAFLSIFVAIFMFLADIKITSTARSLCDGTFDAGFDIDLAAFPARGSMPHIDVVAINQCRRACVHIFSQIGANAVGGCGFLIKRGGMLYVYSVEHVVQNAKSMIIRTEMGEVSYDESMMENKETYGESDDPIVAVKTSRVTTEQLKRAGMVPVDDMPILSLSEKESVATIVYMSPSGFINVIGREKFSFGSGIINVAIDLKHGDSGSPVFAMLNNGSMRYAGAVSRARGNGEANIIASVIERPQRYSPGTAFDDKTVTIPVGSITGRESMLEVLNALAKEMKPPEKEGKRPAKKRRERAKTMVDTLSKLVPLKLREELMAAIDNDKPVRFNYERSGGVSFDYAGMMDQANVSAVVAAAPPAPEVSPPPGVDMTGCTGLRGPTEEEMRGKPEAPWLAVPPSWRTWVDAKGHVCTLTPAGRD